MSFIRWWHIVLAALLLIVAGIGIPAGQYFLGYNLRIVEKGAFYGARQMDQATMERYIDKLGIKTVLNMRGENPGDDWYDGEVRACRNKKITHLSFGWSRNSIPDPESLKRYLDTLDTAPKPFLAHCQGGTHRTGLAAAVYVIYVDGGDIATARKQFGPGFRGAPIGDVLALYETSKLPFRQWVETEYPRLYEEWKAARKAVKSEEAARALPRNTIGRTVVAEAMP